MARVWLLSDQKLGSASPPHLLRLVRRFAGCLLAAACLLAIVPVAQGARSGASLARQIDAILRASPAGRGFWGIEVIRLSDGEILYARNSQHLFEPASNMKMFTTSAALSLLGPDYVFRTTVESSEAPDSEGRVGDIYLVGRGDANLGSRVVPYQYNSQPRLPADLDFEKLADQLVAKGVREVTGNLYADDTYYVYQPYGTDWAVDDLYWEYGAPITALAFNDNSLQMKIEPAAFAGPKAQIFITPGDGYYRIQNNVMTTASGTPAKIEINRFPGSKELDVWGHIPLDSTGVKEGISIENPPLFIGDMFRKLLEQRGVKVDGKVVVQEITPAEVASQAVPPPSRHPVVLAEHDSLPLSQDIKVTLKVSQNLHAEMLLRTLSRVLDNKGSLDNGIEILNNFTQKLGIKPDEVQFAGGSGLSRQTLVSPDAVMKVLQFDARQTWFPAFYDALPVAGVDGTLAGRFHGTPLQGRVHAKTGSLENVNALSGYMDLPNGRRLAFVIIANHQPLNWSKSTKVIDRIALHIYRQYERTR